MKRFLRRCSRRLGFDPVPMGASPEAFGRMSEPAVEPELADLFAGYTLGVLLRHFEFETVLDIGSGEGLHADVFERHGKRVTAVDFGRSIYYTRRDGERSQLVGDYLELTFDEPFDAVWASHVLEHQANPNLFLGKVFADLAEGGVLAITVPPLKHELVGGHLTLWNAGQLLYHLVLAGFDCADASACAYGYNISVIVRKKPAELPELHYDSGDIDRLAHLLPGGLREHSSGYIARLNWGFD